MKQVLVDYIGSITVTPEQISESMRLNEGKVIVSGIMQRGSSNNEQNFNQNGRSYPNVLDLWWNGPNLMGKIEILPTPSGNIAKELLRAGIRLGISSRGMGSVRNLGEGKVEVQDDFEIVCWDLVSNPSTQGAFMSPSLNENVNRGVASTGYSKINSLISDIISVM